jgi:uracil-DNA glycosylase
VHETNVPWNDKSGERLRNWLGVTSEHFYTPELCALRPMGFCYPGTGKSGDLPPRKECAPQWHSKLFDKMPKLELVILIGTYAQKYYLEKNSRKNLTETVKNFEEYLPEFMVLPHPSPRNNIWLKKNDWFEKELVGVLQVLIREQLKQQ